MLVADCDGLSERFKLFLFEDAVERRNKYGDGNGSGDDIGNRFGKEYGKYLIGEELGQDEDKRYEQEYLAQECKHQRFTGLTECDEGLLAGELRAQHEHTGGKYTHTPYSDAH